jgi:hypothetical protein
LRQIDKIEPRRRGLLLSELGKTRSSFARIVYRRRAAGRFVLSLDISEALAIRSMETFSWQIIRENIVDRSMA